MRVFHGPLREVAAVSEDVELGDFRAHFEGLTLTVRVDGPSPWACFTEDELATYEYGMSLVNDYCWSLVERFLLPCDEVEEWQVSDQQDDPWRMAMFRCIGWPDEVAVLVRPLSSSSR